MNAALAEKIETAWRRRQKPQYWLTRKFFLRGLAFIYAIGFFQMTQQFKPLLGEHGLLPVPLYIKWIGERFGGTLAGFWQIPSIFWFGSSDTLFTLVAWTGFILAVMAFWGVASSLTYFILWALYLSVMNVGQIFYGFGWETMMLESGFLAIFLCNSIKFSRDSEVNPPPVTVIWFLRWMLFRVMFGAGLIKIRGDACWINLTCLQYHYETQPIPNPLSWYFHHQSFFMHKMEVIFTHFVELGVPWGYLGPRPVRHAAGLLTILFQITLILSGNLSWLNYLTIVIAFACLDDSFFEIFFRPAPIKKAKPTGTVLAPEGPGIGELAHRSRRIVFATLFVVIAIFSVKPALNLISPGQRMNASYDPFQIVNSYGAFGSVQDTRSEIIISGTTDTTITHQTHWVEYEFKCKPGDVTRRPCFMSPYHYRLDWQMWFAAMSDYRSNDWLVHMIYKLLQGDKNTLSLLAGDPFKGEKPHFIRADLYQYRFTDKEDLSGAWWVRHFEVSYLPPLSENNPSLQNFIRENGWDL